MFSTFAQYLNDQFHLMQILEFFLRVIIACFCGAVIGFERSRRFKEAGIRTHVIVCCAAALIMIISKYGFADLTMTGIKDGLFLGDNLNGTRGADPARVAAQVVSGISFLGAGVIFKNGNTVKGLTTAAGLWATAGIGLAIGCGMYYLGLFTTVLIAVLQVIMHRFKIGSDSLTAHRITMEVTNHAEFSRTLPELFEQWHAKVTETKIKINDDGSAKYDITLRMVETIEMKDVIEMLSQHEGIKTIGYVTSD